MAASMNGRLVWGLCCSLRPCGCRRLAVVMNQLLWIFLLLWMFLRPSFSADFMIWPVSHCCQYSYAVGVDIVPASPLPAISGVPAGFSVRSPKCCWHPCCCRNPLSFKHPLLHASCYCCRPSCRRCSWCCRRRPCFL